MKRIKFEKTLNKVPLPVKTAALKFDYVLRILCFSATRFEPLEVTVN